MLIEDADLLLTIFFMLKYFSLQTPSRSRSQARRPPPSNRDEFDSPSCLSLISLLFPVMKGLPSFLPSFLSPIAKTVPFIALTPSVRVALSDHPTQPALLPLCKYTCSPHTDRQTDRLLSDQPTSRRTLSMNYVTCGHTAPLWKNEGPQAFSLLMFGSRK